VIITKSTDQRVIDGVAMANKVLTDKKFIESMALRYNFDMCNMQPTALIAYTQRHLKLNMVEVVLFKPFFRWSKTMAMFKSAQPDKVSLSCRKLNRSTDKLEQAASIAGSIVHELMHLIDNQLPMFSCGHGNNNPKGKTWTVPYAFGRLAKTFIILHY